jgi:hypothetical protein
MHSDNENNKSVCLVGENEVRGLWGQIIKTCPNINGYCRESVRVYLFACPDELTLYNWISLNMSKMDPVEKYAHLHARMN